STLTPARAASSSRRRPGVRRRPTPTGNPTSSGRTRARRARRNAANAVELTPPWSRERRGRGWPCHCYRREDQERHDLNGARERPDRGGMQTSTPVRERPTSTAPRRWKMWVLLTLAIYPLILLLVTLTNPLLAGLPTAVRFLVVVPLMSSTVVWVVIPQIHRWFGRWLTT